MRFSACLMLGLSIAAFAARAENPPDANAGQQPAQPSAAETAAVEKADRIVTTYYLSPNPDKIAELIEIYGDDAIPEEKLCAVAAPMIGFFVEVFRANSNRIPEWRRQIASSKSQYARLVLYTTLFYADTGATRAAMVELRKQFPELPELAQEHQNVDFASINIDGSNTLYACWGAFFATGDTRFPLAVLRCALRMPTKDGISPSVQAARASIISIAGKTPVVAKAIMAYSGENAAQQAAFEAAFPPDVRRKFDDAAAKAEDAPEKSEP